MKCKCGGELIRIAVDCYQCNVCLLKQAVTFASLPTVPLEINIEPINSDISMNEGYIKQLEKDILKAMMIPEKYFKK